MKRALAAVVIAFPAPGLACGSLPDGYHFERADYVVTGVLTCPAEGNQCEIRVQRHIKQTNVSRIALPRRFSVSEESQTVESLHRNQQFFMCASFFTPRLDADFDGKEFAYFGEFTLRRERDQKFYRVTEYKVRDIDGKFYESGMKCEAEIDDDGRELESCEDITERVATISDE